LKEVHLCSVVLFDDVDRIHATVIRTIGDSFAECVLEGRKELVEDER